MAKRVLYDLLQPDQFDVLSAAWVLACYDENPIITYEGILHRLHLASSFDIRNLIRRRGDLFRQGVSADRLADWKEQLRGGKQLPSWIREIPDETLRRRKIDGLTTSDVFRCQFRATDGAPQATIQVIDWGLQHIDRLRKASSEAREKSAKSWQMWLVFGIGILNIAATIVAAILKK